MLPHRPLLRLLLCLIAVLAATSLTAGSAAAAPGASARVSAADASTAAAPVARAAARSGASCKRRLASAKLRRTLSARCRTALRRQARDRKAPRLSFRAPLDDNVVSGRLTGDRCAVNAWDARGISRVTFSVDGKAVGTDRRAPFTCDIATGALSDGEHSVRAVAVDRSGNRTTALVSVESSNPKATSAARPQKPRGDSTAPSLSWKAPAPLQRVTTGTKLEGSACETAAADDRGVNRVVFYVDGRESQTEYTAPFTCVVDTAAIGAGFHQLRAVAHDAAGNRASVDTTIEVVAPAAAAPAPTSSTPLSSPASGGRWFSAQSVWNAPLASDAPLHPSSPSLVGELRRQVSSFGPWVNTDKYSTPVYEVGASQAKVKVRLNRPTGAPVVDDLHAAFAAVPLPADAKPAEGGDQHLVVYQPETDQMWEFWQLRRDATGWVAEWGGHMKNVSTDNGVFDSPYPTWGATASSLPLMGGLMRLDEMKAGRIDHALAMAIPQPKRDQFVWPAQRTDGNSTSAEAIPEGTRFRLPASLNIDSLGLDPFTRMVADAAQRYGIIVRDVAGAVVLFGEDATPTGTDPYDQIYGGKYANQLMGQFPWDRLQVVSPQR